MGTWTRSDTFRPKPRSPLYLSRSEWTGCKLIRIRGPFFVRFSPKRLPLHRGSPWIWRTLDAHSHIANQGTILFILPRGIHYHWLAFRRTLFHQLDRLNIRDFIHHPTPMSSYASLHFKLKLKRPFSSTALLDSSPHSVPERRIRCSLWSCPWREWRWIAM